MADLEYGPILCTQGLHKGRIGYFDDEDIDCDLCEEKCCLPACTKEIECEECPDYQEDRNCREFAIVYWGDAPMCSQYSMVPMGYCTNTIPMQTLVRRIEALQGDIARAGSHKRKENLLLELEYAQKLFYEKHIESVFANQKGKRLFLSHSSKDKDFANCLYADLVEQGHTPWLDERDIKAGASIPAEIQKGLAAADYVLVLLSPHSVDSQWVRAEWETLFWDEMNTRKIKVIPLLIEDCEIPPFLKVKKYIDFREDYAQAFSQLLKDIA